MQMHKAVDYFEFVFDSFWTIMVGMGITTRHFFNAWLFGKDATLLYPEQRPVVSQRYRGIHVLDIETCIACLQCAKACPIDCIVIRVDRNKETKEVVFHEFSLDYNKCMFCHLCIEPCPVACIEMSRTVEFNVFDREDLVLDLRQPMHQYDSTTAEGVKTGRDSNFTPGFHNTLFNIFKPSSYFEGQEWSRSEGRRSYQHASQKSKLTGINTGGAATPSAAPPPKKS